MTCIVGIVTKKGKVLIGADSAGVAGLNLTVRKDRKVFRVGEFVIGGTSSFRMLQLLNYSFTPPPIPDGADLHKYMCTLFVTALRTCFKEGGYLETDKGVEAGGVFLVGIRGRLFEIESDFQVGENEPNFAAVGCGAAYALGNMYLNCKRKEEDTLRSALYAAAYFSAGVCEPFYLVETP